MAESFLVQEEDGTSKYILEDSSGDLILEESGPPSTGGAVFDDFASLYAAHLSL